MSKAILDIDEQLERARLVVKKLETEKSLQEKKEGKVAKKIKPLDGVVVLEVANWAAGPAAGAILADCGATVIKVEAQTGDSMRYTLAQPMHIETGKPVKRGEQIDYGFQVANRGKNSICVAINKPEGQEILYKLAQRADILLTNLIPERLEKYNINAQTMMSKNPRLIYASMSGYGSRGEERNNTGFDYTVFYAKAGLLSVMGEDGTAPDTFYRTGMGDLPTSLALLSGILAALQLRNKTGEGTVVESSLLRNASWILAMDMANALADGKQPPRRARRTPEQKLKLRNPIAILNRMYGTSDNRYVLLLMPIFPLIEKQYWPRFCEALNHLEWKDKANWPTEMEVEQIFLSKPYDYWVNRLRECNLTIGPVATLPEYVNDKQTLAAGAVAEITHPHIGTFKTVNTPFHIGPTETNIVGPEKAAPEPGEQTVVVLKRLGFSQKEIKQLHEKKIVGFQPIQSSPIDVWTKHIGYTPEKE